MTELMVGHVPRGANYFGRELLIKSLWYKLSHNNILLQAPRRYGKTGAMYQLLDQPREPFQALYMDVEPIQSAGDFTVELLAALLRNRHFARTVHTWGARTRKLANFLRNLPAKIDIGGFKVDLREKTDVAANWQEYAEQIMGLLAQTEPQLLLLIDEFPIMIGHIAEKNREEAQQFLHWFRAARLAPETKVRFVLGGSVNLLSTLDSIGLVDTVNDLYIVDVKPFDKQTAEAFIKAIFHGLNLPCEEQIGQKILDLVGVAIPYQLSVFLDTLIMRQHMGNGKITPEMVEEAFEEDFLGGPAVHSFQHYYSRLAQYYPGSGAMAAKTMLAALSRTELPIPKDVLFQIYLKATSGTASLAEQESFLKLMSQLENDFYIVVQEQGYIFHSRVLRLWWKNRYGSLGVV